MQQCSKNQQDGRHNAPACTHHRSRVASMTQDRARTLVVSCSWKERAHLLEKALDITLARFAGLNDLISHQLLHLTHCCSIVGLNATTGRRRLGLCVVLVPGQLADCHSSSRCFLVVGKSSRSAYTKMSTESIQYKGAWRKIFKCVMMTNMRREHQDCRHARKGSTWQCHAQARAQHEELKYYLECAACGLLLGC